MHKESSSKKVYKDTFTVTDPDTNEVMKLRNKPINEINVNDGKYTIFCGDKMELVQMQAASHRNPNNPDVVTYKLRHMNVEIINIIYVDDSHLDDLATHLFVRHFVVNPETKKTNGHLKLSLIHI